MPILLLTRPRARSEEFAARCRALGFAGPIVVCPVIEIASRQPPPDLARYPTLVVTSVHGAEALQGRVAPGQRAYAVGGKTAAAVARAGLPCISADGDAEALFRLIRDDSPPTPLLHLHGVHSRGDLAARLVRAGLPTDAAVVYDQRARPLGPDARALLRGGDTVLVALFSPRSAALLGGQTPAQGAPRRILALSDAVAAAWPHPDPVRVAARPDAAAMADLVARAANG